jgi:hypothetical protein
MRDMLVSGPLRRTGKLLIILVDLGLESLHLGVRHVDGDSVFCMSRRFWRQFRFAAAVDCGARARVDWGGVSRAKSYRIGEKARTAALFWRRAPVNRQKERAPRVVDGMGPEGGAVESFPVRGVAGAWDVRGKREGEAEGQPRRHVVLSY